MTYSNLSNTEAKKLNYGDKLILKVTTGTIYNKFDDSIGLTFIRLEKIHLEKQIIRVKAFNVHGTAFEFNVYIQDVCFEIPDSDRYDIFNSND